MPRTAMRCAFCPAASSENSSRRVRTIDNKVPASSPADCRSAIIYLSVMLTTADQGANQYTRQAGHAYGLPRVVMYVVVGNTRSASATFHQGVLGFVQGFARMAQRLHSAFT